MLSHFAEFHAVAEEFLDAAKDNNAVIALGKYMVRSKKRTHEILEVPFAHIYTLSN